ncbi:MAG: sulfite exporter TauE/SafE family protein [Candidatus Syntropharchaeia archaeon]
MDPLNLLVAVVILAFLAEYIDVSVGIGYGTLLSPLLLIIGFLPLQVIPSVLLSQILGSILGGFLHHRMGNITLDFRRDDNLIKERLRGLGYIPKSRDAKIVFILIICGIVGSLIGVFSAVSISELLLEGYIGIMVLVIGLGVLMGRGERKLSWKSLAIIALIGSFNKGMSGGGYSPVVTGGQILSGEGVKSSVGNTTIAKGVVCVAAFLAYLSIVNIEWVLAGAMIMGVIVAAPFAAFTVKKVRGEDLRIAIGFGMIVLGFSTLMKAFEVI